MRFVILLFFASPCFAMIVKNHQAVFESLKDYELCQTKDGDGDTCQEALNRWVAKNPKDAFTAGKMTRQHMNHWAAVPFFSQAFKQRDGSCADADVHMAVLSALDLPSDDESGVMIQARDIAFKNCYKELKDELVDSVSTERVNFLKNACGELRAHGDLRGLKLSACKSY